MLRLPHTRNEPVVMRWEGGAIEARAGDSVAAALYAAGIRTLTRSRKFHRPRGLSGSFVDGVLARVDGVPNQRLDQVLVRDGLEVLAQNVWPNLRWDVLRAARAIPRPLLRAGFEHPRWLPSGTWAFDRWEALLRLAAAGADGPDSRAVLPIAPGRRLGAETVVVGGGPAGRKAAGVEAAQGKRVVLVSRGLVPEPPAGVEILAGHEVFGLYRGAGIVACAPLDGGPATLIDAGRVVLATGRRSCPPLVSGADLPGVMDAHAGLHLARDCAVAPGRRVVVIGTDEREAVAGLLRDLGVGVVAVIAAADLRRVIGCSAVTGVEAGRRIACDAVVHVGPWRPDPSLPFQAAAEGIYRLAAKGQAIVEVIGAAASPPEPVVFGPRLDDRALVCPCLDVTVAEVRDLARRGETHVEVVKRLTGCGMGPCQGVPCWDLLAAALGAITGEAPESFGRPSLRPPRRALSLAQAAGLAGLVEPPGEPTA